MSEQELLQAMVTWVEHPGGTTQAMAAVLDVLHKAGYRRCAEGQGVTQWCRLAEDANAAQRAAENDLSKYMARAAMAEAEVERLRSAANFSANAADGFRAEADALRADAERYRWLKERLDKWHENGELWLLSVQTEEWSAHYTGASLDAAIDAARESKP